jgi:cell division protein FtsQ
MPGWRRALGRVVSVSFAMALLGLLVLAGRQLLSLPVDRVVVSGELKHVDRDELKAMISRSLAGGFLSQDLHTLRAPLEAMPWVYRVVVRRQWPDSIEVGVIEQRAIARWGELALLNHAGEVFRPDSLAGLPPLPRLAGPEGSYGLVMQRFLEVQQSLQEFGLQVDSLTMDPRGAMTATLSQGGELVFGREDLAEKLARFRVLYSSRIALRRDELVRVDLRYQHGAAVAWRVAAGPRQES